MITIKYKDILNEKFECTSLTRLKNQKWQWHPCEIGQEDLLKNLEPPILDKKGLKEYIRIFEKGITLKDEKLHFLKFLDHYKIQFLYIDYEQKFWIEIWVKNKYNKSFIYGDEKVLQTMQYEEWDDEYLGTLESWAGISGTASLTEEILQNYINELIEEYEEVTGETYER